jgi:Na+-transporting NADH:ubiquinone oxidoreductase subunit NqrB
MSLLQRVPSYTLLIQQIFLEVFGLTWAMAQAVAGYSGATPLSIAGDAVTSGANVVESLGSFGSGWNEGVYTLSNLFMGLRPGSIGETSTLMCLIGAAILIANWCR